MAGTPAFTIPPHTAVAAAMSRSFRNWGLNDRVHKRTYKKMDDTAFEVVDAALAELYEYKAYAYHHWWCHEHMRFNHVKNEQTRLVQELMFEFLCRHEQGKLGDAKNEKKEKTKRLRRSAAIESK